MFVYIIPTVYTTDTRERGWIRETETTLTSLSPTFTIRHIHETSRRYPVVPWTGDFRYRREVGYSGKKDYKHKIR